MEIRKPIAVVGAGRSGSTVFYRMFSHHSHVTWLTGVCGRYPGNPALNRYAMKMLDVPLLSMLVRKVTVPGENYGMWEHYCEGFASTRRDLLAEDVRPEWISVMNSVFSKMLTRRRNRLLLKITGWPRIGFLREMFPDMKFIHVVRDGRAVACSMLNQAWWLGREGPAKWRWGNLDESKQQLWEEHGKSIVALAGIGWNILMDAMDHARRMVAPGDLLTVRYEELCSDPHRVFENIVQFCELKDSRRFHDSLKQFTLQNVNHKWREQLSPEDQRILEDVLRERLLKEKYL